ncbi:MAG: hypothetical protein IJW76_00135 [Clostridia bacterium]|nr:hypothetical protein [Clostridia bacterium]
MKKIFAVLLSVCLLVLLCACGEKPVPPVLAENERILLAMPQETDGTVAFKYKVITDAEDIEKIISAVNNAPKTIAEENDGAEAISKQVLARIRLSDGTTVSLYGEGEIYINALYKTDAAAIAGELKAVYDATAGEELDWKK